MESLPHPTDIGQPPLLNLLVLPGAVNLHGNLCLSVEAATLRPGQITDSWRTRPTRRNSRHLV